MGAIIRLFEQDSTICVYESNVFQASFTRGLSKSVEWSATLPLRPEIYDLLLTSLRAELWYDKQYGIGGKVQKLDIKYDTDPSIELKGREEIDELYDEPANTALYIDNKLFILQLFTLLDAAGWRFGSYRDIDTTKLVTLDLRKEKQLLTQWATLLKQDTGLSYRFGGFDYSDQPMVDVSYFLDQALHTIQMPSNREFTQGVLISNVQTADDFTKRLWALETEGGNMTDNLGVKRSIKLSDALVADPSLMLDPDFPIYEEQTELTYVVVPTVEGAVGGKIVSIPSAATIGSPVIGEASGTSTANRWASIIFHPYPGELAECSFWLVSVTASLISNQASNPFRWEIKEVDESNVLDIPLKPTLASGIIPAGTWAANQRVRLVFPSGTILEEGKRYALRLGFETMPAASAVAQLRLTATNAAKTLRSDYSALPNSALNTAQNAQPQFEVITNAIDPRVGRRTTDTQTRFVPPKTETNATLAEIGNAATAMYLYTVDQLRNNSQNLHTMQVDAAGINFDFQPGDNILVRAKAQFITEARDEWEICQIEQIVYGFTDSRVDMKFKFLPNRSDTEAEDPEVALYDGQKDTVQTPEGKIIAPVIAWELTEITSLVQNKTANTTLSDGTRAVLVSLTVPAASAGKGETRLLGTPYATHSNVSIPVLVEIVQKPTEAAPTTLICKIGIQNAGWSLYDVATVTAHIVWR